MQLYGKSIKGGFYGKQPSLTDLENGNLKFTTDFRSVYATVLREWMCFENTDKLLKGEFAPLKVFA